MNSEQEKVEEAVLDVLRRSKATLTRDSILYVLNAEQQIRIDQGIVDNILDGKISAALREGAKDPPELDDFEITLRKDATAPPGR